MRHSRLSLLSHISENYSYFKTGGCGLSAITGKLRSKKGSVLCEE